MRLALASLVAFASVCSAVAEPLPLTIVNRSGGPLECQASIAHWFSATLGRLDDGAAITVPLERMEDGAATLRGPTGEAMAVEALWCGLPGQAWQTRAPITLNRSAEARWPSSVVCRTGARLTCTAP